MDDTSNTRALANISSEVDEVSIRLTLSEKCLKAHNYIAGKLRKETERLRQLAKFIRSQNESLQNEIKNAEICLQSSRDALDALNLGYVKLNTEYIIIKEKNQNAIEQFNRKAKMVDDNILKSKKRYESIGYVKEFMRTSKSTDELKEKISSLDKEVPLLQEQWKNKKKEVSDSDRKQIIKLAEFIVIEKPKIIKEIHEITIQIDDLRKEQEKKLSVGDIGNTLLKSNNEEKSSKGMDDTHIFKMPTLNFLNMDLSSLSDRLQKIKKTETTKADKKQLQLNSSTYLKPAIISPYFNEPSVSILNIDKKEEAPCDYTKNKMIYVLEDLKINKNDVYNIVTNVKKDDIKEVSVIKATVDKGEEAMEISSSDITNKAAMDDDEYIEEIDITNSCSQKLLAPPTQFLDLSGVTQGQHDTQIIVTMTNSPLESTHVVYSQKCSQEKKKVSFDLPEETYGEAKEPEETLKEAEDISKGGEEMDTSVTSHTSFFSDESFNEKLKAIMAKKDELDLSPQFVYKKNDLLTKIVTMHRNKDKSVTSKFFQQANPDHEQTSSAPSTQRDENQMDSEKVKPHEENYDMDVKENVANTSVPQVQKKLQSQPSHQQVQGLLFNHGSDGLPESLDMSFNTTGCEDGEAPFIDPNLLLSPKADERSAVNENENIASSSQETPNFLTGFRKTGLSFFGQKPSDAKTDNNEQQNTGGFSFNFGGSEKKTRGGLFSMFLK